jgi:hypothetical protein
VQSAYNSLHAQETTVAPFVSAWQAPRRFTEFFAYNGTGTLWRTFLSQTQPNPEGFVAPERICPLQRSRLAVCNTQDAPRWAPRSAGQMIRVRLEEKRDE